MANSGIDCNMDSKEINKNIQSILKNYKKIAVVGISDKPYRDSHSVAKFMLDHGYQIFPVNPKVDELFGLKCYDNLRDIPEPVELVDIFRKPEHVPEILDQAIEKNVRAVWMQLGVIHYDAANKALNFGIDVVMDRCWRMEYKKYFAD